MTSNLALVLYVAVLIAVVVAIDTMFLQHHFWVRLLVNVGIVLAFGVVYWKVLKNR